MKLLVGNLTPDVTDGALGQMFAAHGAVRSARVLRDTATGGLNGFGFVEMDTDGAARAAIAALHGRAVEGRTLTVHVAFFKPRDDRPNRGFRKSDRSGGRRY
jgi:cold-inducible RNA-binding protein